MVIASILSVIVFRDQDVPFQEVGLLLDGDPGFAGDAMTAAEALPCC